jgi:hypothetical protein
LLFGFTAAFMYEYDRVDAVNSPPSGIDRQLLEQVLPGLRPHLDPRAVEQVEQRLRGTGLLPRSTRKWPYGCAAWATGKTPR